MSDIPPSAPTVSATVILDTPIQRGEQTIASVALRRPKSGELRGIHLYDLMQLDVGSIAKLLPRITLPALTGADIDSLELPDLMKLGAEIIGFLLPKDAASLAS